MPLITFKPSDITIDVPAGTDLLQAARQAGVDIDAPCGGKGTCGKCLVKVVSGNLGTGGGSVLDKDDQPGIVQACTTVVGDGPVVIDVPNGVGYEGGKFAEDVGTHDASSAIAPDPATLLVAVTIPEAGLDAVEPDAERLTKSLLPHIGTKGLIVPLNVLQLLPETLRIESGQITVTLARGESDAVSIVEVKPGEGTSRHFGIAIDIGTTTVAVQLVQLTNAKVLGTITDYNGQIPCGLDVISRINYARRQGGLGELKRRVIETINRLIGLLCINSGVGASELCEAAISGNTTMTHLLLGIVPEYIRLAPYTPTILEPMSFSAGEMGLNMNPHAPVYCSPGVGSYVGGDITAGILCTQLADGSGLTSLFLDIGTNGELVVGNGELLMTCACSAGPAFEGGGIRCGMRAATGAIERVEINAKTGVPRLWTVGNALPRGICGSGMISLVAELYCKGLVDQAGKFDRTGRFASIQVSGRQAQYLLATAEEAQGVVAIAVSETDIDNLIRAKAAIYSACSLMLHQLEMRFEDLEHIYIAGGFGRFLDIEKAIAIGLLPDVAREKFTYIGNSSLNGSRRVLISRQQRKLQQQLARKMTYIDLSNDSGYMDQYTAALFLPHTDLRRFPSVKRLIG